MGHADLFTTPDREVWAYGEALRALARERGFSCIRFSRLRDLVDVPHLPERLDEVTYVGNAFNFRRELMNLYADPAFDPDKAVEENEDVLLTYLGYTRFLKNDLRHIFPSGPGGSARQYKRNVKYIAKQMIIRGNVSDFRFRVVLYPLSLPTAVYLGNSTASVCVTTTSNAHCLERRLLLLSKPASPTTFVSAFTNRWGSTRSP